MVLEVGAGVWGAGSGIGIGIGIGIGVGTGTLTGVGWAFTGGVDAGAPPPGGPTL